MQLPMGTKALEDPLGFDPNAKPSEYDPTKEVFEKAAAELFNLNSAFLRCFATPDGQTVLEFLKRNTIEAGTWMAGLANGPGGMDAAMAHGFAREGQNALIRDIIGRIDLAKAAKSPEDYVNQMQMKGAQNGS